MLEFLVEKANINSDDRIAVGVSGGADSMVLLWALLDLQKKVKFYLKVVNINHNIRGEESDRDSAFVRDFCEKKKIDYEVIDVEAKKLKAEKKLTLEESARKLRYQAFFKVMKQDNLNKLFLAHHKNDQAETILMNIFRGSGVLGASGIKEDGIIFRPLLNLKKSEILKIAKEHSIKFVEDSTNYDNDATRNYLRNIVIPEIEKIYPSAVDAVFAFGERCKEMQSFVESKVDLELIEKGEDFVVVKDSVFENDKILVKEYLKKAFEMVGVFADIESKHYEIAISLSGADVNSMLNFPNGLVLRKTYSGIKIFKEKKQSKIKNEFEFVVGKLNFSQNAIIDTAFVESDDVVYGGGSLYVDYAKIPTNSIWRTRKLGDVFSKLGAGAKKLNDYFTDKKIDVDVRDNIPVLAYENQILVVLGLDVSEKVKVDSDTDQIVKITLSSK